jgi:hypothetical protein
MTSTASLASLWSPFYMLLRYRRLILIDLAALFFLSFVIVNTSSAQGEPASISFRSVQIYSCANDILEGYMALEVLDASGTPIDLSALPDVLFSFQTTAATVPALLPGDAISGISFGVSLPGVGSGNVDVTAALLPNYSVRSPVLKINCGTLQYEILSSSGESSDGRLNPNAGDLLDVLYIGRDDTGSPAIDVYRVDGDSGVFIGEFEYALFEPYLDTPPSTNTRLETIDKATLYALSSGEFQINIGPDAEGKYGIVIFSGLPPSSTRRSILELR